MRNTKLELDNTLNQEKDKEKMMEERLQLNQKEYAQCLKRHLIIRDLPSLWTRDVL